MAVLESIRSRIGILVSIIIGISLLAFILTDFLSQGKSIFASRETEIAQIAGKSINYKDFEARSKYLTDVYKFQSQRPNTDEKETEKINEQAWQQLVDETVMGEEYNKLDITVTDKELREVMAAPHPIIRNFFLNPETKMFDRNAFYNFGRSLNTEKDPGKKAFWLYIENLIRREQLMNKFNSLVRNGFNVTTKQTTSIIKDNTKKVNFNYISVNLNSISDSMVIIKESDLENYYKKHVYEFDQQEATRNIEYITYNILPSALDFQQAKKWIDDRKSEFEASTEIKQYVSLNSDSTFNDKYFKESELSDTLRKFLFSAKIGTSHGPYFENNTYKIARLADIKNLSDSVKVRIILIRPKANTEDAVKSAAFIADSLKNALKKKGSNFASVALKYSEDNATSAKGGEMGWVKEDSLGGIFNECFFGKKGDISVVKGSNGFLVTEISDIGKEVKKVQIGILARKVEPSSNTIQGIYQTASAFLGTYNTGEKFTLGLKKLGISPKMVTINSEMKIVPGLTGSRDIIRWAFSSELDELSDIKTYPDKFVIAHLTQIRDKGNLPLKQVRDQIIIAVKREKKLDLIMEKVKKDMTGTNLLEELANKLHSSVKSANDVTFGSYSIPEVGYEPALIATAVSISPNKISEPIKGKNAVYVINVTNVSDREPSDLQMVKMRLNSIYAAKVNGVTSILMKLAKINDNRIKFF